MVKLAGANFLSTQPSWLSIHSDNSDDKQQFMFEFTQQPSNNFMDVF